MDLNNPNANIMAKRKEFTNSSKNRQKSPKDFSFTKSKFEHIKEIIKNHPYSLKLKKIKHDKFRHSESNDVVTVPFASAGLK